MKAKEIERYVPKGRRQLMEKQKVENSDFPQADVKIDELAGVVELPQPVFVEQTAGVNVGLVGKSQSNDDVKEVEGDQPKKPKFVNARPVGRYIPPHLRNASNNSDKQSNAEDDLSKDGLKSETVFQATHKDAPTSSSSSSRITHFHATSYSPPPTVMDDSAFRDDIDEDKLGQRCLLLTGFSNDLAESRRQLITNTYLESGGGNGSTTTTISSSSSKSSLNSINSSNNSSIGNTSGITVKWVAPQICLVVGLNEQKVQKVISSSRCTSLLMSNSNGIQPQSVLLKDSTYFGDKDIMEVAKELYRTLQPQRDSRVANRLIGAALGIRLPKKTRLNGDSPIKSNSTNNEVNDDKNEEIEERRVPANLVTLVEWDDND